VEELASQIGATAVVVCDHRKELLCAGQPSVAVHCRSIGKTLLGALFGRHVASGAIELDATPADPGIDDSVPPSLTSEEWSARVRDLLTCRPGIYHPSNHQGEAARAALPPRGAHRPGSYFLQQLGLQRARHHLRTRDRPEHVHRVRPGHRRPTGHAPLRPRPPAIRHPGLVTAPHLRFHISARDLARFGQLRLDHGESTRTA